MKSIWYFLWLVLLITINLDAKQNTREEPRIEIGQRAYVKIIEADMEYLARVDSGARLSSLHALNIRLEEGMSLIYPQKPKLLVSVNSKEKNEAYTRDIGRMISFDTVNEKMQPKHLTARITNVVKVRNAQGTEYRYVVRLGIRYHEKLKYKEVNLRDRSDMNYKLLIGRNWLDDDFVIKTDEDVNIRTD